MDKPPERDGTGKEPLKDRPPYFTEMQWEDYLRANGRAEESKGGGAKRKKPPYLSDEEWAAFKREHPDLDDKVVQLDQSRKRKAKPPPTPPPGGWPEWVSRLRRDDRGRVIPDLANVMIALRGEEKLAEACAFDEMLQHSVVQKPWPRLPDAKPAQPPPHETDDDDIGRLQEWLQRVGLPKSGARSSARRSKCSPASAGSTRCAIGSTASFGTARAG